MYQILSNPIVAIIVLLGVLVFIHEFGHFIVGRIFNIGVEIFSIGIGPKLIGLTYRGTDYRISWFPLGGFVKFAGATPTEPIPPQVKGIPFYQASFLPRV